MHEYEFKFSEIEKAYVLKELLNVDCTKAVGVDGIHPKFLKLAAVYIAEPLTYLFNMSLKTCIIPNDFKTARITPIHKGGSHDIDNFRPISVLPSLSKILERAIHTQLYKYLNENKLHPDFQSGFRPFHSTATCLTEITDYLFDKMDQGHVIGSIFLDLRKAFDVIPHNFILRKLMYYGIKGNEYNWMKSYLIDRRQCVTVNNCTSECVKTKSGVPQGSILGPLIFCLFINDMCYLNLHVHTKISLYADDTALFNSGKTIKEVQKNLQEDFELIWKWLDLNSMHLHPRKTKTEK